MHEGLARRLEKKEAPAREAAEDLADEALEGPALPERLPPLLPVSHPLSSNGRSVSSIPSQMTNAAS